MRKKTYEIIGEVAEIIVGLKKIYLLEQALKNILLKSKFKHQKLNINIAKI